MLTALRRWVSTPTDAADLLRRSAAVLALSAAPACPAAPVTDDPVEAVGAPPWTRELASVPAGAFPVGGPAALAA